MTEHPLEVRLRDAWPLEKWSDVRSIVAVSGGADSIGLLRAVTNIARNRDNLTAAHLNHGLRGCESDLDQEFVEEVCRKLSIQLTTERVAANAIAGSRAQIGTESAARNLRYRFLRRTAESIGARYILTAHSADDQAETVLHNICRGTGLAGLAGIPFARRISDAVTVVRPLLSFWRTDILSYLDQINQTYRTDSSNESSDYTRNRIRNEVMPRIEREVNRSARKHIVQLARLARETTEELDRATSQLDAAIVLQTETELRLDPKKLSGTSEFLIVHFLKRCWAMQKWPARQMHREHWGALAKIVSNSNSPASADLPGRIRYRTSADDVRFFADHQTSGHTRH